MKPAVKTAYLSLLRQLLRATLPLPAFLLITLISFISCSKSINIFPLTIDHPYKKAIFQNDIHSYQVILKSGQYARIVVGQKNTDLSVSYYTPNRNLITNISCGQNESVPLSLI